MTLQIPHLLQDLKYKPSKRHVLCWCSHHSLSVYPLYGRSCCLCTLCQHAQSNLFSTSISKTTIPVCLLHSVLKVILIWQTSSLTDTCWCVSYWFPNRLGFLLFPVCRHPEEPVNGALLTPAQSSFTCCSHKDPFTLNIHYCRTV